MSLQAGSTERLNMQLIADAARNFFNFDVNFWLYLRRIKTEGAKANDFEKWGKKKDKFSPIPHGLWIIRMRDISRPKKESFVGSVFAFLFSTCCRNFRFIVVKSMAALKFSLRAFHGVLVFGVVTSTRMVTRAYKCYCVYEGEVQGT